MNTNTAALGPGQMSKIINVYVNNRTFSVTCLSQELLGAHYKYLSLLREYINLQTKRKAFAKPSTNISQRYTGMSSSGGDIFSGGGRPSLSSDTTHDAAVQISLEDMKYLEEAMTPDDDWTGLTLRRERKKRQNRLNQRAYSELIWRVP